MERWACYNHLSGSNVVSNCSSAPNNPKPQTSNVRDLWACPTHSPMNRPNWGLDQGGSKMFQAVQWNKQISPEPRIYYHPTITGKMMKVGVRPLIRQSTALNNENDVALVRNLQNKVDGLLTVNSRWTIPSAVDDFRSENSHSQFLKPDTLNQKHQSFSEFLGEKNPENRCFGCKCMAIENGFCSPASLCVWLSELSPFWHVCLKKLNK